MSTVWDIMFLLTDTSSAKSTTTTGASSGNIALTAADNSVYAYSRSSTIVVFNLQSSALLRLFGYKLPLTYHEQLLDA
jgi:hypothetical protein